MSPDRPAPASRLSLRRAQDPSAAEQPLVRSARKDGRRVATIRRLEKDGSWVVEAEVYPVNSMLVEPKRPGPYVFASLEEADAFVEETARALEYLGCSLY